MKEKNKTIKDIILACIPLIIITIIEIFFKAVNGGIYTLISTEPNSLLFSILIGYIIYAILICIFKKNSNACIIFCLINFLLLIVNQIKITYTGEPIYFSDINFISKIGELAGIVYPTINMKLLKYIIYFAILLIIFLIIIKYVKKQEITLENNKIRGIILCTCLIIIALLFIPNKTTNKIYQNLFFNINNYKDYASYTTSLSYYQNYTFLSGMYGTLLNNRFEEPENYNEQELEKNLQNQNESEKNLKKSNIIVVFSEAFWDVDKLEEIKFNTKITSNFNRLKEEGKCIELLSCAYGGMSENVAFELLTGGKLNYFSKGYVPIMSLYKKEKSKQIPSIIKELNKNNYNTKIVFGKDYYNSKEAFIKMGFDQYEELEENPQNTKGLYISDEHITDLIIKELENKASDEKIFYMAETIQNHMPFIKEKYKKYDIKIEKSNLSEEENNVLLSYAQGIYDADQQLNKLYEYIKQYKQPTILIFLGDHLPYLYTDNGDNLIDKLEYFNVNDELEKIYRKYNTQALILSNYDINYQEIPELLSPDLLLTYLINKMDIGISNYYKWLYSTMYELPAFNRFIAIDKNNKICDINNLGENLQKNYQLRENMQYKFFITEH